MLLLSWLWITGRGFGSSRLRAIASPSLTTLCSSNLEDTHLLEHLLAIGQSSLPLAVQPPSMQQHHSLYSHCATASQFLYNHSLIALQPRRS
ncbi:hypothetical protein H6G89_34140 [Oscillatoria sp. FACHB-1407]|uniref:hypothetical protein n=1 Tax=Oscillatoria sp. FACHB-1407 TaxID=2692847 RepID=UPI00168447D5|nr:hypothetical protein [Oscillatoria sp. FACHB-1407]MBD2466028.1 hypothetical protein [Oscillatoria sp. FACHB-1407]